MEENNLLRQKIGRNFDSFAACLRSEIKMQLLPCMQKVFLTRYFSATLLMFIAGNQLGRSGGHGSVFQVVYYNQQLAVKVFECEDAEAWRRELKSLTFLSHRNIVRIFYIVYESENDQRRATRPSCYAMELMTRSAGDEIEWSLLQLLCVFEQIAAALSFCHDHEIVHFDVKPENILLDDSCMTAKLCDFGHAHKLRSIVDSVSASVVSGMQRGTLSYMAPECTTAKWRAADQSYATCILSGKLCGSCFIRASK
jgi:serine/threonine protein kinase